MSRIGKTTANSRIYNLALGRYEQEFEMGASEIGNKQQPASGLTARQVVSEAPLGVQRIIFSPSDAPKYSLEETDKYIKAKEKADNVPTTEYQKKIGIRSEGSFMDMAKDKPYIELAGKALNGDLYSIAPSTDLLTEQDMYKLMTVYKPSMAKPKTQTEQTIEEMAKVGQPYKQEKLSRYNTNPREFMEQNLQEIELYPSEETNKGDGGSNLVFDYKKEMNKGTQPMTREQLYNANFNARKATSGINMMQRDAAKARDVLSVYGNKQHVAPKSPPEAELRPAIIKGQQDEARAVREGEEEGKQDAPRNGGEIVFQAGFRRARY